MTPTEDDRDLAAALLVALGAGLLTTAQAILVVDREIQDRPSTGGWLIAASLARQPADLMHASDRASGQSSIVTD